MTTRITNSADDRGVLFSVIFVAFARNFFENDPDASVLEGVKPTKFTTRLLVTVPFCEDTIET